MRPEGLSDWKVSVTPSEIEPATFRLVAQCLNQLRHREPLGYMYIVQVIKTREMEKQVLQLSKHFSS
jgi:hypothetical protein